MNLPPDSDMGSIKNIQLLPVPMDSLRFAARYMFMPNRLKYEDADNMLFSIACGQGDAKKVAKMIEGTAGISLFLNLIAEKNKLKMLDHRVLEAYWIGNELLDNVSSKDIKHVIMKEFTNRGLDKSIAKKLVSKVPEGASPHHSFHVRHINSVFGNSSSYGNVEHCIIRHGRVKSVRNDALVLQDNQEIKYEPGLISGIRKGDSVAYHWKMAVDKLTKQQASNLQKYNEAHEKLMG